MQNFFFIFFVGAATALREELCGAGQDLRDGHRLHLRVLSPVSRLGPSVHQFATTSEEATITFNVPMSKAAGPSPFAFWWHSGCRKGQQAVRRPVGNGGV